MRIKSIGVAAAAAVVLLSGTVAARDLMVVGFGGPFQDNARTALFQGYAKATNQPVKDDVYNGEMAKVYSMVKSGDVTYDVIMVEAPELVRGCEDGVGRLVVLGDTPAHGLNPPAGRHVVGRAEHLVIAVDHRLRIEVLPADLLGLFSPVGLDDRR